MRGLSVNQKEGSTSIQFCECPDPRLPDSGTVGKKLLFISYLIYRTLFQQPEWMKIPFIFINTHKIFEFF